MSSLHNLKLVKSKQLNFKPSPPNVKDYKVRLNNNLKLQSKVSLPSIFDNTLKCSPVIDQGDYGSCTAFASVGAMEFIMKQSNNTFKKLSENFAYYTSRVNIENMTIPPIDNGAYLSNTLKGLVKYGTCLNTTCPYVNINNAPSAQAYSECKKYQIITYAKHDDATNSNKLNDGLNIIKTTISAGYPIVAGFTCYSNIYNSVNGAILMPTKNDTIIGGHAVLIVGYNDVTKQFKFKNSWGTSWGNRGYGYLPYEYYLNGDLTDIWGVYTQSINNVTNGIIISTPTIVQNQMSDIFEQIMLNYSNLANSTNLNTIFTQLVNKYKDNKKLVVFINNMKMTLITFNQ